MPYLGMAMSLSLGNGIELVFVMATNDVYLGNPNLKKAGTPIQFTKKQINEWVKCKK